MCIKFNYLNQLNFENFMKDFKAIAKANSFDYCLKLRFIRNSIMN